MAHHDDLTTQLGQLPRAEKIAVLRQRMAALGGDTASPRSAIPANNTSRTGTEGQRPTTPASIATVGDSSQIISEPQTSAVLPLPDYAADASSRGGLICGAVTSINDCPTVINDIIATTTAAGSYCAVIGGDDLCWAAIADAGGDLSRISVITPRPEDNVFAILGVLCEGLDLVLYRAPQAQFTVTPSQSRPIQARLRQSQSSLLVCGPTWPGAAATINAHVAGFSGVGRGQGRIRQVAVDIDIHERQSPSRRSHTVIGASGIAAVG